MEVGRGAGSLSRASVVRSWCPTLPRPVKVMNYNIENLLPPFTHLMDEDMTIPTTKTYLMALKSSSMRRMSLMSRSAQKAPRDPL